ncbi:MAG TPA: helix-turn-helix domain-containing protein [Sandaracinaceae bacterium LLY-WYZ-13_1]|nr:helix-turn-helix domain-containing protein [Sandaracinaceae bacterium LLY-WYZ-13_1]
MGEADLIQALTQHGFSLNESRAYTALLSSGPSTGYEVGQKAQIPRSAVYGALRRLVAAGAARSIPGSPERFVAAPADSLLSLLRDRFEASAKQLESAVKSLDTEPPVPDAFSVHGYERVLEEARQLIQTAGDSVVISGWPRELEQLRDALADAGRRGVGIWLFSHAAIPDDIPGTHYSYGLNEVDLEDFWKHRIFMVADDQRTLIGATEGADSDNAVISETAAIAEIATSQIALDLTLLAQRASYDTRELMAEILGDRVGRLDDLLPDAPPPVLGRRVAAPTAPERSRSKRTRRKRAKA